MDPSRREWLQVVERFQRDPARPGSNEAWSPALDFASADELRAIQSEKLRAAVRFAYACVPFYRKKLGRIGLEPGDVRGLDDLVKIPVTTKHEMAEDVAANPPWGTYTSVDDRCWAERGWQMFASSGTTSRPRAFRYTRFDREMWAWANARAMWAMGFRPGRDSAMLAFGYGPHVWLWECTTRSTAWASRSSPAAASTRGRAHGSSTSTVRRSSAARRPTRSISAA